MGKRVLLALLFAIQSFSSFGAVVRHANFRTESNLHTESTFATIESILLNNTMTRRIHAEIHMEKAEAPKNKMLYVILCMVFGFCGCDRCFMGQICLGCLKGFTLGGFIVWQVLDYIICICNALTKEKEQTMLGYNVTFEPKSIEPAFIACIVLLLFQLWNQYNQSRIMKANLAQQQAMMEQMQKEMEEQQAAAAATAGEAEPTKEPTKRIPLHQNSLVLMPTMLTRNLRKAGFVPEKPTVPELIAAFEKMDKDGDGQLDPEEIKEAMLAMGATDEDVEEMIKSADTDGDGKISKDEFLKSQMPSE